MLRAIIGTAAVLAGFGVLERSVDASTGYAGSCTATQAYALLQRGEMVSVRAEPTPQASVIGTLSGRTAKGDLARGEVTIMGSQSGWARIALNTAPGYAAAAAGAGSQSFGWVPADLLTVDARVDGAITVYDRPGLLGSAVATIEGDDMKFRVLGCRGSWLQVVNARHGNVWIDKWCAREEGCRG
ncbi:SH3 domain-containing protein [Reyranella soli]|uniref:SH3b domain-containing protein n=1 Tax=Reyranella soli TaxID=1230389 RepID=A0A512NDV9_9HYPH|nr:hypothetical protein [Reyranella soli]GEP57123.1 hypothetical protein RSO01_42890 [Reyranella soli]